MKPLCLLFLLCSVSTITIAQSTELSVQLSSGFFAYGGESAVSSSSLYTDERPGYFRVNGVFGEKSALSYGLQIQAQRVTKRNFLWGARLGYDRQSARSHIDQARSTFFPPVLNEVASGTVRLNNHVVHVNPYFGYVIPLHKIRLDMTAGVNLSSIRSSSYSVSMDEPFARKLDDKMENGFINTKWDFGPVAGLAIHYNKMAVSASYAYGLRNYQRMTDGANREVYSRYFRLGIAYRIR
jgi:hypothetical protein